MKEYQPVEHRWTDGFRYIAYYTPNGWYVFCPGYPLETAGSFSKEEAVKIAKKKAWDSR